eukprot:7855716-Pyramimonas_sp.AAC.1
MAFPTTDQPGHRQSAREQQRFIQQQHQSAMAKMRLLGADVTDRNNWTPPWDGTPMRVHRHTTQIGRHLFRHSLHTQHACHSKDQHHHRWTIRYFPSILCGDQWSATGWQIGPGPSDSGHGR